MVKTVLIQVGDILDRDEEEIAILSLLRSLDKQAKAKGGAVFQTPEGINGSHVLKIISLTMMISNHEVLYFVMKCKRSR
ncbi:shewanella-like protein phosphatase 1 isoform X2 [Arachis stenosperma]|uniref:shewanella-like protein phosphatase 1 isoform X2 n=1 Tax=Arachis stenosperma TaxID=217475 RepID=UPI0025AD0C9C|nr:shewanella-like protein phosphatase 1 isoform X2 [Arachis stenosperma]